MKKIVMILSMVLMISLYYPQAAFANDYLPEDTGYVTNAVIQIEDQLFPRPGLDSFPETSSLGPYNVSFNLADGSPITRAVIGYGIQGSTFEFMEALIDGNSITATLPPMESSIFSPCRPAEEFMFYLSGFDAEGNLVEQDERNRVDGIGGDPYRVVLLNPNPNQPPVAVTGGEYTFEEQVDVTLNGNQSYDPEGGALTFAWDVYSEWSDYFGNIFPWDDQFNDGEGETPGMYFEHAGQYHVRLMVTDACGESNVADSMIYVLGAHVVVTPQHDGIHALDWKEGVTLTLSVDGVVYDTQPVHYLDQHSGYGYDWNMRDFGLDIVAGQLVQLESDDGTVRWHEVRDITITGVDYGIDQISGTAPAGTYVRARAQEPLWTEVVAWADDNNQWVANFPVDITKEVMLNVLQQNDWDASHTLIFLDEPGDGALPSIMVEPVHGWAQAQNWPIGVEITLTVDDDSDLSNGILYTSALISEPADWDPNMGMAWFELGEIRELLGNGLQLTMTDGTTVKQTVIVASGFYPVDSSLDILSGFGPPNVEGNVFVNTNEGSLDMQFLTDAYGSFSADFGTAGLQLDDFLDAGVVMRDEDGDGTMRHFQSPRFVSGSILPNPVAVNTPFNIYSAFEGYQFSDKPSISSIRLHIFGYGEGLPMTLNETWPITTGSFGVSIAEPGVYPVVAEALDVHGYGSGEFLGYLVVYDPLGGFVTGGGKVYSPAGAYLIDPTLTGMATFGFVSKYHKGATIPSGQTEFQFKAGNLNFHSEKYEWMVAAGKKVMFKGSGTINGKGNYLFMISAIDGDLKGGDGIDRFRIRIWSVLDGTEVTVYDNQVGDYVDADPVTAITSGSIVIHK